MIEELNNKLITGGGFMAEEDKANFQEMKELFIANQKAMADSGIIIIFIYLELTFDQKVENQKKKDADLGIKLIDIKKPHLIVLNEDPQLSHKLKYSLKDLPVLVGRKHGSPPPEIILTGIGIKINHASFEEFGTEILLLPNDVDAKDFIFINGQQMQDDDGEILSHMDRITFGTNSVFLYMKQSNGTDLFSVDWESAQLELHKEVEKNLKKQEEISEKKRVDDQYRARWSCD